MPSLSDLWRDHSALVVVTLLVVVLALAMYTGHLAKMTYRLKHMMDKSVAPAAPPTVAPVVPAPTPAPTPVKA